jgi:hypothetical protein
VRNQNTFLYNTGAITSLDSTNWNVRQFYTLTKVVNGQAAVLGSNLACPPCNIGPQSTPSYAALAQAAMHTLPTGETVFAGQRAEGFYVDLGAVFDLLELRPFENLHVSPMPAAPGVNGTNALNVHSIAIQVPISQLTSNGSTPTDPTDPHAVIGVWATASRRKVRVLNPDIGGEESLGPWVQVSRLGNPLINEAIIPRSLKNAWNARVPSQDSGFASYYEHPEVASLLPVLYPNQFPNLAGLTAARADLVAILLTGIPAGVITGFQNYTGATQADMLRLNMAIPPAANPNVLGILGNDLAGFPNGRRVIDDVFTIELRALAGVTYALVASYTPDAAAMAVNDGLTPSSVKAPYLTSFPYLGVPYDGFDYPAS